MALNALWACWCCKAERIDYEPGAVDDGQVRRGVIYPASVFNEGNAAPNDDHDEWLDPEKSMPLNGSIRNIGTYVGGSPEPQPCMSPGGIIMLLGIIVLASTFVAATVFHHTVARHEETTLVTTTTFPLQPVCLQPCKCLKSDTTYTPPGAVLPDQCPGLGLQSCMPSPGPDSDTPFPDSQNAICHNVKDGAATVEDIVPCLGGTVPRPPAYLVVGEEKAAALVPGLRLAIAPRPLFYSTWKQGTASLQNLSAALEYVLQPGDVVVFSLNRCHEWMNTGTFQLADEFFTIASRLQLLTQARMAALLLVASNPAPSVVARSITLAQAKSFVQRCYDEWAKLNGTNVVTLEFQQHLCDQTSCTKFVPGLQAKAVSGWEGLLTDAGSRYLAPFFCSELASKGLLDAPPQAIDGGTPPPPKAPPQEAPPASP